MKSDLNKLNLECKWQDLTEWYADIRLYDLSKNLIQVNGPQLSRNFTRICVFIVFCAFLFARTALYLL